MIAIVCLDDNQGMLFNQRRQSRDAKVLEDIWTMTDKLWISSFSEKLFMEYQKQVEIDDDFLQNACEGEYCFVENQKLSPYTDKIEQLIVYKWNRKYPVDFKLDINLKNWKLIEQAEFAGSSHEKITKELYASI
ncbi:MAG: ribonuclease Z [Tyzzerella sp.]|nr:ribonuclease Z [Tyzzerella sp.]